MKLFHFYGLNSGHNWYNPGHRNLHLFRSTQVREVPARCRYLRLERARSTAPTENNVCLGKDALKPLKNTSCPWTPLYGQVSCIYIYICSFYLSCLAHHVSSFTYGLYLWGIVWINPPLVNQPVAKRHPSIPLIHGWIMKWSKLVFLSWLPSGKLTRLWKITIWTGESISINYMWALFNSQLVYPRLNCHWKVPFLDPHPPSWVPWLGKKTRLDSS